ncbi:hypothetical protein EOM09_03835 [bacterium]|nr:hypothetical protein [bacterium]
MVFTSDWNKKRWKKVKTDSENYKLLTGKKENLKSFWKKENPLNKSVIKYNITYELNYKDPQGRYVFSIAQDSIEYYARSDADITQTMEKIKTEISTIFRGKGVSWTYDNLKIKPRGAEIMPIESDKINYHKIRNSGGYFPNTNKKIRVEKQKGIKTNINTYGVDIWQQ